jgi:hypothetical protein
MRVTNFYLTNFVMYIGFRFVYASVGLYFFFFKLNFGKKYAAPLSHKHLKSLFSTNLQEEQTMDYLRGSTLSEDNQGPHKKRGSARFFALLETRILGNSFIY